MKFETLKTNCARSIYNNYTNEFFSCALIESVSRMNKSEKRHNTITTAQELKNEAYNMIMRTDIRNIKSLSDQFPNIVPSWIKSGHYVAELSDNGWELFNTTNN